MTQQRISHPLVRKAVLSYVVSTCVILFAAIAWSLADTIRFLPELLAESTWSPTWGSSGLVGWVAILLLWVFTPLLAGLTALLVSVTLALSLRDREEAIWLAIVVFVPVVWYLAVFVVPTPELLFESELGRPWRLGLPGFWLEALLAPGLFLLPVAVARLSVLFAEFLGIQAQPTPDGRMGTAIRWSRTLALGRGPFFFWVPPLLLFWSFGFRYTFGEIVTSVGTFMPAFMRLPAQAATWLWIMAFVAMIVVNLRASWTVASGDSKRRFAWFVATVGMGFSAAPVGVWGFEAWMDSGPFHWSVPWFWLTAFTAGLILHLRAAWADAGAEERRGIARLLLWVGFAAVVVGAGGWTLEVWMESNLGSALALALSGVTTSLPTLVFAFLAFIVVFIVGAMDPRLAIRRGTLYGGLGSLFIFFFAGVATLAEGLLETYLGLPRTVGAILTGGTTALVLFPIKRRLDRIIDHLLPATAFAEGRTDTAAIVFSDIVGYTRLTGQDEKAALTLLSLFYKAARRLAGQNGGRLVNTVADEVVLEFKAAKSALRVATELQRELRQSADRLDLQLPELCTGIHYGEVTRRNDGNLFGDTMNLASRVQGVAEPGQVVFSQAVADQVGDVAGREDLGERTLKNVSEPIRCYVVSATSD